MIKVDTQNETVALKGGAPQRWPMYKCAMCKRRTRKGDCCTGHYIFVSKVWEIKVTDEGEKKLVMLPGRIYKNGKTTYKSKKERRNAKRQ